MGADHSTPAFTGLADLASARVGGRAVATNDDFFAPKSNLVKPEPPIFIPGKYTSRGKWMDGWESRRRRTPGHDWCVVAARHARHRARRQRRHQLLHRQLPVALLDRRARRVTAPPRRALRHDRAAVDADPAEAAAARRQRQLASRSTIARPWTHLRLNIFPDGGVARLRVYGEASIDWTRVAAARDARSIWRRS